MTLTKIIPLEEEEQVAIAQYLDIRVGYYNWCHVPNEAKRSYAIANKLKAQGMKPGFPDIQIFKRSKKLIDAGHLGIVIEMKRINMTPSDVKPEQKNWIYSMADNGWLTYVAKGAGDAIDFLKCWGY